MSFPEGRKWKERTKGDSETTIQDDVRRRRPQRQAAIWALDNMRQQAQDN